MLGLIDAIVPSAELLKVSRRWALDIAERRKPWMRSLHKTDKIGSLSEAHEILKVAREQVKQTVKNMPQHMACIEVIEEGIIHGGYNGVLKVSFPCQQEQYLCVVNTFSQDGITTLLNVLQEAKVFKDLLMSDTSKGLVHIFFSQRATSKVWYSKS